MSAVTREEITGLIHAAFCMFGIGSHEELCPFHDAPLADAILALFAARRDAEVEALWGQVMNHDSDLATIADCVNTALRECERGGAQITNWTPPEIKGAINELVYRNTVIRQNLDTIRDQVRALAEENAELHGPLTTKVRAADVVMKAIDDAVTRHYIDARSPIADARLDYGDPFKYTDDALRARAETAERAREIAILGQERYRERLVAAQRETITAERERDALLAERGLPSVVTRPTKAPSDPPRHDWCADADCITCYARGQEERRVH